MKTIGRMDFKDAEADLQTLGDVCRELETRGFTPQQAAASVLSQMATEAMRNGMDNKEVMDALFAVISGQGGPETQPGAAPVRKGAITEAQAEEIKAQVKYLQNLLLYWDMILCSHIQQLASDIIDELKQQGMYRHELKKCANSLSDESRRLQALVNGNDRILVVKWCRRIDPRDLYTREFFDDGASIVSHFMVAYCKRFDKVWDVIRMDCRTIAKTLSEKHERLVTGLLEIEALTNTGVELFDSCVRRMKALVAGHGKASITKSTHHESMRNAAHNLLRRLGKASAVVPDELMKYARDHLAAMQRTMIEESSGDFFQERFDLLSRDFVNYLMAWMRIDMEFGKVRLGAIRMVYDRLGTRHRVEKFFSQLRETPLPQGNADVWDVADFMVVHALKHKELMRFENMCLEDRRHIPDESQAKQEARILRQQARRNKGMLPDSMIHVMFSHYRTKKALVEHLGALGFELKPTLERVKKMKVAELKQIA